MSLVRLAVDAAAGTARSKLVGVKTNVVWMSAVAVCGLIATIFLLIAATIAIASEIGAVYACLVMALLFLVAAGAMYIRRQTLLKRKKKDAEKIEAAALATGLATESKASVAYPLLAMAAAYLIARSR